MSQLSLNLLCGFLSNFSCYLRWTIHLDFSEKQMLWFLTIFSPFSSTWEKHFKMLLLPQIAYLNVTFEILALGFFTIFLPFSLTLGPIIAAISKCYSSLKLLLNWSSGRTLGFRPLGQGFETGCILCLDPFHPSSHCPASGPSLIRPWLLRSDVKIKQFTHSPNFS